MKRCTKCILPENYPGITFNEDGICNHCITYQDIKYLGGEALKERIETFLKTKKYRNKNYHCILGLSGGRDSTYLLYYLVKILNLKVLAYCVDNGFIPQQTILNLQNMTDILNVKLIIENHNHLKKCFKHLILSWMIKPSPEMVSVLCMDCNSNIEISLFNFAKKNKIPILISGGTPFESQNYRVNLMKINPNDKKIYSFILGYLSNIIKNPKWIQNCNCLIWQFKEFYYRHLHYSEKKIKKSEFLKISPFWNYIRWKEYEVITTIENQLNWKKNPNTVSTGRGDCDIALLKLYLYKKTIGFNDKDDDLSNLIRDNQISREEALKRLEKEGDIPEKVIKNIFDKLGLDYSYLNIALRKVQNNKYEKKNN